MPHSPEVMSTFFLLCSLCVRFFFFFEHIYLTLLHTVCAARQILTAIQQIICFYCYSVEEYSPTPLPNSTHTHSYLYRIYCSHNLRHCSKKKKTLDDLNVFAWLTDKMRRPSMGHRLSDVEFKRQISCVAGALSRSSSKEKI